MVYRDLHWRCPRDGAALEETHALGHAFRRCPGCRGAFVDVVTFTHMLEAMGGLMPLPERLDVARPLGCPACAAPLARQHVATPDGPVELDTCAQHGLWFDANELQRVLEAAGLAGLAARR
jgi:Zn-finger nucleic acid-binding protein